MSSMSDMIWFLVCTVWRANNHSAIFTHMSHVLFYSVIMHHICSNYSGFIPSVKVLKQISVVFSCSEKRGSSMHVFVHMTCTTCPRACAHVFSYQLLWYSIVRVRFILVYIHFLEYPIPHATAATAGVKTTRFFRAFQIFKKVTFWISVF